MNTRTLSGTDLDSYRITISDNASDDDLQAIESHNQSVNEIAEIAEEIAEDLSRLIDQPAGGSTVEEIDEKLDRVRDLRVELFQRRQDCLDRRGEIIESIRDYRIKTVHEAENRLASERKKGRRKIENLGDAVLVRLKSVNLAAFSLQVDGRTEALTGVGEARGELQAAKVRLDQLSHSDSQTDQAAARLRDDWAQFVRACMR